MAIGLCAECNLELVLVNPSNKWKKESLEVIKGSTVAGAHGLPMWQYARINKTISSNLRGPARIKLVAQLDRETPKPLWAVANVRMCPPIGVFRTSSRTSSTNSALSDSILAGSVRTGSLYTSQILYPHESAYTWPNVTCQKLFYNESIVVSSVTPVTPSLEFGKR